MRLLPLTRLLYGEDRPKQYAALLGSRSLFRQTLDRVALAIPPERTVVVTLRRPPDIWRRNSLDRAPRKCWCSL